VRHDPAPSNPDHDNRAAGLQRNDSDLGSGKPRLKTVPKQILEAGLLAIRI
jgi:hypothetical protein